MQVGHQYSTILYEVTPDRVAAITLNRPDALNAFDRRMCEEMRAVWRCWSATPALRAASRDPQLPLARNPTLAE